jgi:hypothetical protein
VVVFTKFDGQIVNESITLNDDDNKWEKARKNADTFQRVYLPKVLNSKYPPKGYVRLEGRNGKGFLILHKSNTIQQIWILLRITVRN